MSFWQLFLNNPEWALVIVGILTMGVVGWQAIATSMSVRAAKESTEAVVTIYRPWLLYDVADPPGLRIHLVHRQGREDNVRIVLQFKNYGQTPAWVLGTSCKLINIEGPNIPEPLEYGPTTELLNPNVVPPNHPFRVDVEPLLLLRTADMAEISQGKRTLCVYGYLKYQIFTGKYATTNFCLRYSIRMGDPFVEWEGWDYAGPAGANRHT